MRETSTDYQNPYRPRLVRLVNAAGRRLPSRPKLDYASLFAAAKRRASLSGYKTFDFASYRSRMDALLEALRAEARLTAMGRIITRETLIRLLATGLRADDYWARHREVASIPVERPVFIAGLQRTGTTMLHRLLASDPAFRHLRSWEAFGPAPVLDRRGRDRRVADAQRAERALRYLAPDFFAIHPVEAHAPEEDVLLFDYGFWSTSFEATYHVPSFSTRLEGEDHTGAYREHRQLLQILSHQQPRGRWLNKTPHHTEHLDALLEVYPDAKIIQCHRDPARALASFCSMICHGRGLFTDRVDPAEVGRHWLRKNTRLVNRAMATRARVGDEQFLDIRYDALMADPLAALKTIYDFLDMPFTPEVERRVQEHRGSNPQHKHGRHRYTLEDFGLTRAEVNEGFRPYCQRFELAQT